MSTIANLRKAPAGFDLEGLAAALRRLASQAATVWNAMGEGAAAARRYRELTARGLSHDEAAARVFADHFDKR